MINLLYFGGQEGDMLSIKPKIQVVQCEDMRGRIYVANFLLDQRFLHDIREKGDFLIYWLRSHRDVREVSVMDSELSVRVERTDHWIHLERGIFELIRLIYGVPQLQFVTDGQEQAA
jgi:hypothetical protein